MKLFLTFILWAIVVIAQEYIPAEVLTGIPHEKLFLPEGKTKASIDEIATTPTLMTIFDKYGVIEIEKVFPNFQREDTLILTEKGELVKIPDLSCIYKLIFPIDRSVDSLVEELENSGDVNYAEPNHIFYFDVIPNDPRFPEQWNLHQANDYDINAPEAWDIQVSNTAIKIGIFDSGIDWQHPDMGAGIGIGRKVTGGWNYIDNNSNVLDKVSHGTHVAGIAGALTHNNYGVAGVAGGWGGNNFGSQLFSFVIGNEFGVNADKAARAIQEAAFPSPSGYGINVMNLSWGGYNYNRTLRSAITAAYLLNRVIVAAKGNENSNLLHYPSDFGNASGGKLIISVGATDSSGVRSSWSNFGNNIDIVAPGSDILSTMPTYQTRYMRQRNLPSYFHTASGTSMSAPHVTGLAALLFSQNPNLTCEDVQGIIQRSAKDIRPVGYDESTGYGQIGCSQGSFLFASTLENISVVGKGRRDSRISSRRYNGIPKQKRGMEQSVSYIL